MWHADIYPRVVSCSCVASKIALKYCTIARVLQLIALDYVRTVFVYNTAVILNNLGWSFSKAVRVCAYSTTETRHNSLYSSTAT